MLFADAAAIVISMVAGPLRHTSIAIGAAISAGIISLCLIAYGLYFLAVGQGMIADGRSFL